MIYILYVSVNNCCYLQWLRQIWAGGVSISYGQFVKEFHTYKKEKRINVYFCHHIFDVTGGRLDRKFLPDKLVKEPSEKH